MRGFLESTALNVLNLPGWQNSGPDHWQTHWERLSPDALYGEALARQGVRSPTRVDQGDWIWPRRGDWMARLDEVIAAQQGSAVLVAHSLGCHLVTAWAAHTQRASQVVGALLVAPPDVERTTAPPQLSTWRTASRPPLPFRSLVLYSEDDPYADSTYGPAFARRCGGSARSMGAVGHINADSALGDWPEGRAQLVDLLASLRSSGNEHCD